MDGRHVGQFLVVVLLLVGSGCQAITTVFETGVWMGVILVLVVLAVVGFIAARIRRSTRTP